MSRSWPPKKSEFIALVEARVSQAQIAARYSVPKGWVVGLARRWGIAFLNRAGGRIVLPKKGCLSWPPKAEDLRRFVSAGLTQTRIAEKYNCSSSAISEAMASVNVAPARPRTLRVLPVIVKPAAVKPAATPAIKPPAPPRQPIAATLVPYHFEDITVAEIAMLRQKFPPLSTGARHSRDWASLHDPRRAVA